jgi:hypothetical protein
MVTGKRARDCWVGLSLVRRPFLSAAVLLLSLVLTHSAVSFSSTAIGSGVDLTVTGPSHGLVSFVSPSSGSHEIRQGQSKEVLVVTNNLGQNIYGLRTSVLRCSPENVRARLFLGHPETDFLGPGEFTFISLSAADDCPVGDVDLTVGLEAEFDGGKARVLADLSVHVEKGELTLLLGADGFTTSWNGGESPEGTVILYRYKPLDGGESDWTGWQEAGGASLGETLPGYYEYKAVFGSTESEVISRYVEPPAEPEAEEASEADVSGGGGESGDQESEIESEHESDQGIEAKNGSKNDTGE